MPTKRQVLDLLTATSSTSSSGSTTSSSAGAPGLTSPSVDTRHAHVVENGYDLLRAQPEALARMMADDEKDLSSTVSPSKSRS